MLEDDNKRFIISFFCYIFQHGRHVFVFGFSWEWLQTKNWVDYTLQVFINNKSKNSNFTQAVNSTHIDGSINTVLTLAGNQPVYLASTTWSNEYI
jgi:hypothetical protein